MRSQPDTPRGSGSEQEKARGGRHSALALSHSAERGSRCLLEFPFSLEQRNVSLDVMFKLRHKQEEP